MFSTQNTNLMFRVTFNRTLANAHDLDQAEKILLSGKGAVTPWHSGQHSVTEDCTSSILLTCALCMTSVHLMHEKRITATKQDTPESHFHMLTCHWQATNDCARDSSAVIDRWPVSHSLQSKTIGNNEVTTD